MFSWKITTRCFIGVDGVIPAIAVFDSKTLEVENNKPIISTTTQVT